MRSELRPCVGGWALPLICLALLTGSSLLAAALQQSLMEQERIAELRHDRLQAQALGEGLLSRVWALIDDPRAVDTHCRTTPPVVQAAGLAPFPAAPASQPRFAERLLNAGRSLSCRIALQGTWDVDAWQCDCSLADTPPTAVPLATGATDAVDTTAGLPPWGYAELKVESTTNGRRLVVQACVLRSSASGQRPACGSISGSGAPPAIAWRASIRLEPDAQGRWREVAGSWTDLP